MKNTRSRLVTIQDDSPRSIAGCPLGVGGAINRRDAVQKVGGWAIYLGALSAVAGIAEGCGPGVPSENPNPVQGTPTPSGTATTTPAGTATPTPTGSGTATPTPTGSPQDACGCTATPTGTNTALKASSLALYAVAYNSASQLFICHDDTGFYCMDALCPHAQCDMGTQGSTGSGSGGYKKTDVHWGFKCNCHGSDFDANGNVLAGSATSQDLPHYQLAVDTSGNFWVDWHKVVGATCRC